MVMRNAVLTDNTSTKYSMIAIHLIWVIYLLLGHCVYMTMTFVHPVLGGLVLVVPSVVAVLVVAAAHVY